MKAVIVYASWSGNTEEVAEMISATLREESHEVSMVRINPMDFPLLPAYDVMFFGTFTWEKGQTPDEVKDFVAELNYKPKHVYVFGTGDTQFGGDALFCKAADKLHAFYNSSYVPLKIEQSPRGTQEQQVITWTKGVVQHWNNLNE